MHRAAGSDTTATGLRATLLGIISSPLVYKKLMTEIDEAVAAGKISSDDLIISNAQARDLPYLQACIKEVSTFWCQGLSALLTVVLGLRWYPPIAGMLAKKVSPCGSKVCGC